MAKAGSRSDGELDALEAVDVTPQEAALAERVLRTEGWPRTTGGPDRPMSPGVVEDVVARVGSMLARGWDAPVIRRTLKISRRQYDRAMRELLTSSGDRQTVFAKFKAANASHLRQLAAVRTRALAMSPPALMAAIRATLAMKEVSVAIIVAGQSFGYYRSVQPEARATLDDQDSRRELPNLERSEGAGAMDELSDMLEEWQERDDPVSEDPETGVLTVLVEGDTKT